jgi:hypothetical protein
MVTVLTMACYSAESLPMLICWPCFVVRPAFMMKRLVAIGYGYSTSPNFGTQPMHS